MYQNYVCVFVVNWDSHLANNWYQSCLVYIKEVNRIGKLDDQSTPRVLSSQQLCWRSEGDPMTQRVRTVHDIVFDEGWGWTWGHLDSDVSTSPLTTSTTRGLGE
jgi:hypothetical protein